MTTQPHPYPAMTAEQHRAYAADLVEAGTEVEFMTVIEAAGASDHVPGGEISETDAQAVHDLALRAQIAVTWPGDQVTAQPAAEQAEPTTITTPVEIGVHDLAVGELAQQVYAIAHDVDRDLVEPHHDGVPEILALLQAYEDGLLASVAHALTPTSAGVPARRSPDGHVAVQLATRADGHALAWVVLRRGDLGLDVTYYADDEVTGWPLLAEVATAAGTEAGR